MDQLDTRPPPPEGWSLIQMPNGALIIETPASIACLVTATDAHTHSRMLWRLLNTMAPNRKPTIP